MTVQLLLSAFVVRVDSSGHLGALNASPQHSACPAIAVSFGAFGSHASPDPGESLPRWTVEGVDRGGFPPEPRVVRIAEQLDVLERDVLLPALTAVVVRLRPIDAFLPTGGGKEPNVLDI